VADGGLPALPCHYEIRREKAIGEILRDWKARGEIKKVKIVRLQRKSATEEERIEALLKNTEFDYDFVSAGDRDCDTFLRALAEEAGTGIILLGAAASLFAFRAPDSLTYLMNRRRVALVDGPVSLPFANTPTVRADLAMADWEAVASGITAEFLNREIFMNFPPTTFEAKAYLQAPLNKFSQTI